MARWGGRGSAVTLSGRPPEEERRRRGCAHAREAVTWSLPSCCPGKLKATKEREAPRCRPSARLDHKAESGEVRQTQIKQETQVREKGQKAVPLTLGTAT